MSSSLFSSRVSCKRGPLERLRKVVVLEDVIESKRVLESTESSVETILDELAKLKKIHVAFETLAETKIGVAVHRLRKHADSEVKTRAKSLVSDFPRRRRVVAVSDDFSIETNVWTVYFTHPLCLQLTCIMSASVSPSLNELHVFRHVMSCIYVCMYVLVPIFRFNFGRARPQLLSLQILTCSKVFGHNSRSARLATW